jgi:hypothetical protein
MSTLVFFIKRDLKDNIPLWVAPLLLFIGVFTLSLMWRNDQISSHALKISLQICTFLFIFVSATLYGKYLNSVIGSSMNVRTQMSLTRSYLFSLPLKRGKLFWYNQVRLILPLIPFVMLTTIFVITFNPVLSKITAGGLATVGFCLSWLVLNYFTWICHLIEKTFENRSLSHAFKAFFILNPVLLLVIYYLCLRNINVMLAGPSMLLVGAYAAPIMMMGINYFNWLKRD